MPAAMGTSLTHPERGGGVADEREVPGPARDNNDRILERGYEGGFAQLPREEVDPIPRPGAGPHGALDEAGPNVPLLVIALGGAMAFASLGFNHAAPLGLGLLLVVVGAVWAGARSQTRASGAGTGPTTVPRDE